MNVLLRLLIAASFLPVCLLPTSALAAHCKFYTSAGTVEVPGPFHMRIHGFTATINTNVAIGQKLTPTVGVAFSSVTDNVGGGVPNGVVKCDVPLGDGIHFDPLGAPTAIPEVFETGIAGVGVRISHTGSVGNYPTIQPVSWDTTSAMIQPWGTLYLDFIKTGPISAGGSFSEVALWTLPGPNEVYVGIGSETPIIIVPNRPTCAIDLPDIPVQLADVEAGSLPNLNDTAAPKDFNVTLTCGGGDAGQTAALKMALTDQSNTANTTTELNIRSQPGDAAGVKVQILRNGAPLPFGPAPTVTTAANVWSVQAIGPNTGTVTIPLKARLIRKGVLAPGQINAVALYSVMYD